MNIFDTIQNRAIILDGAMGTMTYRAGLVDKTPETYNFTNRNEIIDIHRQYINAGADIIYTNTFGANKFKCDNVAETVKTAVAIAKEAKGDTDTLIALDIGSLGVLIEPIGTLTFDDAVMAYREIVRAGVESGVDLIVFETIADIAEARAGVIAAKEECDLPIMVSMTFNDNGYTYIGTSAVSALVILQGMNISAFGINCTLTPKEMCPIVDNLLQYATIPIAIKANAGLPDSNGIYIDEIDEFYEYYSLFVAKGVRLIGGCCGTNPDYIAKIATIKEVPLINKIPPNDYIATTRKVININQIETYGECIDCGIDTKLIQAIQDEDYDYLMDIACEQMDNEVDIININIEIYSIDDKDIIDNIMNAITSACSLPIMVKVSSEKVLELIARRYSGRLAVSVKQCNLQLINKIIPVAQKYGICIIADN